MNYEKLLLKLILTQSTTHGISYADEWIHCT